MTSTGLALLCLVCLHLALAVLIVSLRGLAILAGAHGIAGFSPDGEDVSPFAARIARVHANGYENMPAVGAVLLYAIATGNTAVTDPLAMWLVVARLCQSAVHASSIGPIAVSIRFSFFAVQLTIVAWWVLGLVTA